MRRWSSPSAQRMLRARSMTETRLVLDLAEADGASVDVLEILHDLTLASFGCGCLCFVFRGDEPDGFALALVHTGRAPRLGVMFRHDRCAAAFQLAIILRTKSRSRRA